MRVNPCPCCGNALLRHARREGVYWYCTSCHQEMTPLTSCHQEMTPLIARQLVTSLDAIKPPKRTLQSVNS